MRFRSCIFFLFAFVAYINGQSTYTPPKIPANAIRNLDEAVLAAAAGNTEGPVQTIRALIEKHPSWTLPRQQLSKILYSAGKKHDAINALEGTLAIDTISQLQQVYALGRLYEETGKMSDAFGMYKIIVRLGNNQPELVKKAHINLAALEQKRVLWESNETISFTPMPSDINTPNEEYLGRWTLDGKELIFTRRLNHQEDLFTASFADDGKITISDFPFNTEQNEAAQAISPDGKFLVFTACDKKDGLGGCDLYVSVKKVNGWSAPVNMGKGINTPAWESQPCFGQDGMSIYFSSSRPGGIGGRDIWVIHQISEGRWSLPVNAGPQINTANNEASPFIHFDNRTMYFMRDGKEGLGGYDLYIARMGIDGKWMSAENMKAPINSGSDEGALSLHPNGKTAIITRMTENQLNDLFEFELPEAFLSSPVQALRVHVFDDANKSPLHARMEIFQVNEKDTIRNSQWADEKGMIIMTLDKDREYGAFAIAEGYMMHSLNLSPDTTSVRNIEIGLIPIAAAIEKTIVLENVFFATGSSTILDASETELKKLYQTLVNNPEMHIELRGHTDNVGNPEDNLKLSEARAKAVYQYLIDHGINGTKITFRGFGETIPVASNETPAGRKQNRRTEFYILKNK